MPLTATPLRAGICGLGSAAERAHLPALSGFTDAGALDIVAVCDASSSRLAAAGALLPRARCFTTVTAMLAGVDLDVLVVATPPSAHVAAVRAGLQAGLAVVCEKPLALWTEDVAVLAAALQSHSGASLISVHQYEHAPAWQALARVIRGALRAGEEWRLEVDVQRPGTDPLSAGGWRAQPEREGGILGDHAVHYLAMLWKVAPGAVLVGADRQGPGGRETARVELSAGSGRGHAEIAVSYAGGGRYNRVRLIRPERGLTMAWENGRLIVSHAGDRARRYHVDSLADRNFVNSLYTPFYADVIAHLGDAAWRTRRNAESLGVARLLATALEGVRITEPATSFIGDLRAAARAVLLAFADLGIHLGSERDLLLTKARSLDPENAAQLTGFLDLAISAGLITPAEAGRLRLAPQEALRLAQSLDGRGPVPEAQASAWANLLGRA